MKKNIRKLLGKIIQSSIWGIVFIFTSISIGFADSTTGKITLDWNEFRSMMKLDTDEVTLSWEEFSKIIEQTGAPVEQSYRVEGGNVVLTRNQFKKLLETMKQPVTKEHDPPCEYSITKSAYRGVVGEKSTTFHVQLDLEIFKKKRSAYTKIPLFREDLAIKNVSMNQKPASIITEGGWYYLTTHRDGVHNVQVEFSVASSIEKGGPGLNFNIPETPVTSVELDIPMTGLDVSMMVLIEDCGNGGWFCFAHLPCTFN